MLKSMREGFHNLKWILLAVVASFVLGFVFIDMGMGGAAAGKSTDRSYAAKVNGQTISARDYLRTYSFTEENYKRMYGGQWSPELAEAMGLNRQVLEQMVDQRLLLQEAQRLHLEATPEEVRKKILDIQILNPDGKWAGDELYNRYIQSIGFNSASEFEDELANEITINKIESALANSVVVSPKAAEAEYRRSAESAKIRYALYSGSRELPTITVAPAEVDAYYKANASKYTHGEQRELKYLVADTARIRMALNPTEQQIKTRYDATKEEFKRQEQAHILHILIKVDPNAPPAVDAAARAKAEGIVKQLRGGADFGALAKANSQDPSSAGNGGDMGFIDRGMTVEPFDQAAFSIPLNQISDPIRTKEFGYHIIKVLDRRPAGYKPFEEVRLQIASQIANQMAQDQAKDEIAKVSTRIKTKKPANPTEFSANANDRVSSNDTQWFSKGESIPGLGFNQPLATWAFAAKQGDISDVVGTQRGPAIAYVAGIRPAGVTALAEIRPKVEADAKAAKARDVAKQKLAAAMPGAANVDAVAAKLGLTATDTTVNHQAFVQGITGDTTALVDQAMSAPVGQVHGPVVAGDGAVVFQVTEQKRATPAEIAQNRGPYVDTMRQREARSLRTSLLQRLRKGAKIEVNNKIIDQGRSSNQEGA